jgi:hypothetical protein
MLCVCIYAFVIRLTLCIANESDNEHHLKDRFTSIKSSLVPKTPAKSSAPHSPTNPGSPTSHHRHEHQIAISAPVLVQTTSNLPSTTLPLMEIHVIPDNVEGDEARGRDRCVELDRTSHNAHGMPMLKFSPVCNSCVMLFLLFLV